MRRKKIDDKAKTNVHPPVRTHRKKTTHEKFVSRVQ